MLALPNHRRVPGQPPQRKSDKGGAKRVAGGACQDLCRGRLGHHLHWPRTAQRSQDPAHRGRSRRRLHRHPRASGIRVPREVPAPLEPQGRVPGAHQCERTGGAQATQPAGRCPRDARAGPLVSDAPENLLEWGNNARVVYEKEKEERERKAAEEKKKAQQEAAEKRKKKRLEEEARWAEAQEEVDKRELEPAASWAGYGDGEVVVVEAMGARLVFGDDR